MAGGAGGGQSSGIMRLLIRVAISLGISALALTLCALLVDGFSIQPSGFLVAVAVLAVCQTLLAPLVGKLTDRYATAMMGGVGIIVTLISLVITAMVPGGVTVQGPLTWLWAALIVWIFTALGGWLLVRLVLKPDRKGKRR